MSSEDQTTTSEIMTSDELGSKDSVVIEAIQNGSVPSDNYTTVEASISVSSSLSIEHPIAERLVDEAVEEAVEQVTKMTVPPLHPKVAHMDEAVQSSEKGHPLLDHASFTSEEGDTAVEVSVHVSSVTDSLEDFPDKSEYVDHGRKTDAVISEESDMKLKETDVERVVGVQKINEEKINQDDRSNQSKVERKTEVEELEKKPLSMKLVADEAKIAEKTDSRDETEKSDNVRVKTEMETLAPESKSTEVTDKTEEKALLPESTDEFRELRTKVVSATEETDDTREEPEKQKEKQDTKLEIDEANDLKDAVDMEKGGHVGDVTSEEKTDDTIDKVKTEEDKDVEKGTEEAAEPEEYMDILGNGCLKKKTLVPGEGRETRPLHGDTVSVSYVSLLNDSMTEVESGDLTFVVGDGDVIQALDLAIALTELHEEFELITDAKYAYGVLGLPPKIPPNASLVIKAKLIRTDEPPAYYSMPWPRLLAAANEKRERGNFLFGRNEFALSINSYNKALEILNSRRASDAASLSRPTLEGNSAHRRKSGEEVISEPEDKEQAEESERYEKWKTEIFDTKVKIYNNMAAAQIRVEAYEAAVNSCDEVLKLNPDNVKAWFRRGKAKVGKGEYNEAVRSLRTALKYDPESRIVQNELKRVMASVKAERETQQRIYRRMFGTTANDGATGDSGQADGIRSWRRYLWYGAAVAAVGMSLALVSAAFKYHQQHT